MCKNVQHVDIVDDREKDQTCFTFYVFNGQYDDAFRMNAFFRAMETNNVVVVYIWGHRILEPQYSKPLIDWVQNLKN